MRPRQKQKERISEVSWFIILLMVGVTFILILISPFIRYQLGGKWSVPVITLAFLSVLYLQPRVSRHIRQWHRNRRDEADDRWWRERDKREQAAHLRTEALRLGKIRRDEKRKKK